jgi:hypothetical protein
VLHLANCIQELKPQLIVTEFVGILGILGVLVKISANISSGRSLLVTLWKGLLPADWRYFSAFVHDS